VRALTQVALQATEQRSQIGASSEREILAAHLAEATGITELRLLPSDGSGCIDLNGYILFCYPHDCPFSLELLATDPPSHDGYCVEGACEGLALQTLYARERDGDLFVSDRPDSQ